MLLKYFFFFYLYKLYNFSLNINSPNLITLTGFGFMVINLILAIILVPDLEGPTYRWFYFRYISYIKNIVF